MVITGDLFKRVYLEPTPLHNGKDPNTGTVGMRAKRTLLECCLVISTSLSGLFISEISVKPDIKDSLYMSNKDKKMKSTRVSEECFIMELSVAFNPLVPSRRLLHTD